MGHNKYQVEFEAALTAYRNARSRRLAAQDVEEDALQSALFNGGQLGLSVRELAAMVRLPKTTVARLRISGAVGGQEGWIADDPVEYVAAHNSAWSHMPSRQIAEAPFTIERAEDGNHAVHVRPRGVAGPRSREGHHPGD